MKKKQILINIISYTLLLLAVIFIVLSLKKIDFMQLISTLNMESLIMLCCMAVGYTGIVIFLSFNYAFIIKAVTGAKKFDVLAGIDFLQSNIAKYIPSNLMHFAGRQVMLSSRGYTHKSILGSTLIEFMFLITTALLLILIGLISGVLSVPDKVFALLLQYKWIAIGIIGVVVIITAILMIKFRIKRVLTYILKFFKAFKLPTLLALMAAYLLFFTLISLMLYFILITLSGQAVSASGFLFTLFSFAVIWLIGFIVPGVPGGIGIREALLLIFFPGHFGATHVFSAAILLRVITISGDVFAYVYAISVRRVIAKRLLSEQTARDNFLAGSVQDLGVHNENTK